jgi:hypothetical protein
MRVVLVALVLTAGCLAAPAEPLPGEDGGTAGGGEPDGARGGDSDDAGSGPAGCVPGSQLDLAYVSAIAMPLTAGTPVTLASLAVVVNPGVDPIELGPMSVRSRLEYADGDADFTLLGGDQPIVVPPGEAKGALSSAAANIVLGEIDEVWTDVAAPALAGTVSLRGPPVYAPAVDLELTLDIGGYSFPLDIRLYGDLGEPSPMAAARARAVCF